MQSHGNVYKWKTRSPFLSYSIFVHASVVKKIKKLLNLFCKSSSPPEQNLVDLWGPAWVASILRLPGLPYSVISTFSPQASHSSFRLGRSYGIWSLPVPFSAQYHTQPVFSAPQTCQVYSSLRALDPHIRNLGPHSDLRCPVIFTRVSENRRALSLRFRLTPSTSASLCCGIPAELICYSKFPIPEVQRG